MIKFKLHRVLGTALAVAAMFGAPMASAADVAAGNTIVLTNELYPGAQGPFKGTVLTGAAAGNTFAAFCVEKNEHFSYGQTLYVGGVTDHTVNATPGAYGASSQDPLSAATAWLFTQYFNNTLSGYSNTASNNDALQNAIWALEDEPNPVTTGMAGTWAAAAIAATTGPNATWSGIGNVRVLNLYTDVGLTAHAQDQLYMVTSVPEPESLALMLAGLGLMGGIARRRKQAQSV